MTAAPLIPVILSGGVGSRLWPVSREIHPKPFMALPDGQTLIEKTFARAASLSGVPEIVTVTNRELLFITEDEYRKVDFGGMRGYILEPTGRNTAGAVAVAAHYVRRYYGERAQLLVMAADHLIADAAAFVKAIEQARIMADQGWLVTFGIQPDYPETGYGYLQLNRDQPVGDGFVVNRFVEKPDADTASKYLAQGDYLWNAGIFCFQAGVLLDELSRHGPALSRAVEQTFASAQVRDSQLTRSNAAQPPDRKTERCLQLDAATYEQVPATSIDYALMEKSDRVASLPCQLGWSDVGCWKSVTDLTAADTDGNRLFGEVLTETARENFAWSEDRLVALVGVDNLVVVDTPDALLVAHRDQVQSVRAIVERLKASQHPAHLRHRTVFRPWGSHTLLEEGEHFRIRRVEIKSGASLSMQTHKHRSEHWIVVQGRALIQRGDEEQLLLPHHSTFVLPDQKHRLSNPGDELLIIIEVQSGAQLSESDITLYQGS